MVLKYLLKNNQKGFVLPVGLMFLAILGIIGTTAALVTTTDLQIGINHKAGTQAFYAAIAGYEEARGRLPGIRQIGPPDANWRGFVGNTDKAVSAFEYDNHNSDYYYFPSLQTDLNYTVLIRHKTDVSGNVLLWGDRNGDFTNEVNLVTGTPIEIISSRADVNNSSKTITIEVRGGLPYFDSPSALYVNGDIDTTDSPPGSVVDGTFNSACTPIPDIITTVNATTGKEGTDWSGGTSGRPIGESLIDGYSLIYPVAEVMVNLAAIADNLISPGEYTDVTWGTAEDIQVTYCEGILDVRDINGYGILAVNGNLNLRGNISWYGLIIINSDTWLQDEGHLSIKGAVVVNGNIRINGQPDVFYDCMVLQNLENSLTHYSIYNWLEDL